MDMDNNIISISKDKEIVKMSNKLAEAKYRLSLQAQRIYLYAVSQVDENAENFNIIKFSLSDYADMAGIELTRLYKDIEDIAKELMGAVVKIKISDDHWKMYHLMSTCEYNRGTLTIKFDKEMKPYLLNLKERYSQHFLETTIKFSSKYSIRIYQILKANQYKFELHNIDYIEFDLVTLREMLGLDKTQYKLFKDFRVNVLDKAKDEINEKSDIKFDYDTLKLGRKVVGIKFMMENNFEDLSLVKLYTKELIDEIKEKSGLKDAKFSKKQILELYEIAVKKTEDLDINVSPFDYIRLNYKYMIEKGTARKKFAYLKKSLENDYASAAAQLSLDYEI